MLLYAQAWEDAGTWRYPQFRSVFKLVPTVHAQTDLPIAMSASPPSLLLKFSISFKTSRLACCYHWSISTFSSQVISYHSVASLSLSNQQSVVFFMFYQHHYHQYQINNQFCFSCFFFFFIGILLFIYAQLQNLRLLEHQDCLCRDCLCQATALNINHPKCYKVCHHPDWPN